MSRFSKQLSDIVQNVSGGGEHQTDRDESDINKTTYLNRRAVYTPDRGQETKAAHMIKVVRKKKNKFNRTLPSSCCWGSRTNS